MVISSHYKCMSNIIWKYHVYTLNVQIYSSIIPQKTEETGLPIICLGKKCVGTLFYLDLFKFFQRVIFTWKISFDLYIKNPVAHKISIISLFYLFCSISKLRLWMEVVCDLEPHRAWTKIQVYFLFGIPPQLCK